MTADGAGTRPPRVSVCIPTYNRQDYLLESVRSVLAQTFADVEVVVVDDASTDATRERIGALGDPRLRYHRNETNLGLSRNFNRCLQLARGEYVTVFGDDDVMLPHNVERKVAVLDAHPRAGFVHSNAYSIDARGDVLFDSWFRNDRTDRVEPGLDVFRQLLHEDYICFPSGMIRRACLEALGGFDESLGFTLDWELWMRLAVHHDVAYLGESLIRYRSHAGAVTARWWQTLGAIREAYLAKQRVLTRFGERIPDRAAADHTARWVAAKHALRLARRHCGWREYAAARECVAFAGEVFPAILGHPRGRYVRVKVAVEERIWKVAGGAKALFGSR